MASLSAVASQRRRMATAGGHSQIHSTDPYNKHPINPWTFWKRRQIGSTSRFARGDMIKSRDKTIAAPAFRTTACACQKKHQRFRWAKFVQSQLNEPQPGLRHRFMIAALRPSGTLLAALYALIPARAFPSRFPAKFQQVNIRHSEMGTMMHWSNAVSDSQTPEEMFISMACGIRGRNNYNWSGEPFQINPVFRAHLIPAHL